MIVKIKRNWYMLKCDGLAFFGTHPEIIKEKYRKHMRRDWLRSLEASR